MGEDHLLGDGHRHAHGGGKAGVGGRPCLRRHNETPIPPTPELNCSPSDRGSVGEPGSGLAALLARGLHQAVRDEVVPDLDDELGHGAAAANAHHAGDRGELVLLEARHWAPAGRRGAQGKEGKGERRKTLYQNKNNLLK